MKKVIYSLIVLIIFLLGLSTFVSSTYFFNKYIAKNIKEYGFSYKKVDGAIFEGFRVKNLTYKGKELSSRVELRISPFKLFKGLISVNKLYLLDVRKDVLEDVVEDFKPKENNTTGSAKIDLNFEFKNIYLTIKPFSIDNIKIKHAKLKVDKISYIDYKFDVGNLRYSSKSNLADVSFSGQFKKRVLKIEHIDINNLDSKRFILFLKGLKSSNSSNKNSSQILNSPFTPKIVEVKEASLNLIPFKFDELSIKDLKLNINRAKFDVDRLMLIKGHLILNYLSKEIDINLDSQYIDNNLTIKQILVNIKKPNRVEKFFSTIALKDNNSSTNNSKLIPIKVIKVNNSELKLSNYIYKKERLKRLILKLKDSELNLDTKKINANSISLKLLSTLGNFDIIGSIKESVIFNNINIKSDNVDKIIGLLQFNQTSSKNSISFNLPKEYLIKNANIKIKKLSFNPFIIDYGSIKAKNIKGKTNSLYINSGSLNVYVKSPWGKANLDGNITNNYFFANGGYKVSQNLLDRYSIPLKAKNLEKLGVKGKFGFSDLDINVSLNGKDILKGIKNIDIISSKSKFTYNYLTNNIFWKIDANINTPYTNRAKLTNTLTYIDNTNSFNYFGKLIPNSNTLLNRSLNELFKNLQIEYKGGYNTLKANLNSKYLIGRFITNYKDAKIKIENLKDIKLSKIIETPKSFKNIDISKLIIDSNLNFNKILPLKGSFKIASNLVNLNGKWSYKDRLICNFITSTPKSSIIFKEFKNIKYSGIKSFKSKLIATSDKLYIELKNSNLDSKFNYNIKSNSYLSNIKANALSIDIKGDNNTNIKVTTNSIKSAIKSMKQLYKLDIKDNIDGKISSIVVLNKSSLSSFKITSPLIIYKKDKSSTKIEDLSLNGNLEDKKIVIKNYNFRANGYKIFSNRDSIFLYSNTILDIKKLWVNDSLLLSGNYNLDKSVGKLKATSDRFELDSNQAKVVVALDANINIFKDKKDIKGTINILSGDIKNSITRKNVADNEDIIILQRKREKESTDFAKNVKLDLKIVTTKGLIYSQNGSYIKLIPDMTIKKSYNKLSDFRGVIKVAKGSYYTLNGKRLVVTKGLITFKGKSSSPYLNIELKYRGKDYTVYVNVSGTPTRTVLYFRSNPPLTKEQILAYLLFDDSSAVGTHNKEAMLNMIGGSLAKSFLGSIGIKLDHISVKENGFSIGKNITKNISVYYNQNREKPSIKTRIDITKSIHTDIEVGKDKQSADIIFSSEY